MNVFAVLSLKIDILEYRRRRRVKKKKINEELKSNLDNFIDYTKNEIKTVKFEEDKNVDLDKGKKPI